MPGAAAERGLGFAGAEAKRPAGITWGRQGQVGEARARWGGRGQVWGEAGASCGGRQGPGGKAGVRWGVVKGKVGRQGSGWVVRGQMEEAVPGIA